MSEETKKILEMIKDGTISEAEGEKLIEALYAKDEEAAIKKTKSKSTLRIKITSNESGKDNTNVNVNIPLVLAKKISGLTKIVPQGAKEDLNEQGINLDEIDLKELIEMFENGEIEEDLVNIDVDEDDEKTKVRIYVD